VIFAAALVIALGFVIIVVARAATGGNGTPAGSTSASPPASASTTTSPPPPVRNQRLPIGKIGAYTVAETSLTLVDRSHPRLGARVIPTEVRYPVVPAAAAASGRLEPNLFPLVVFAPGYQQCDDSYSVLLHEWASAGYVVAAVEFPRTKCHLRYPDEPDLVNEPADVSSVIRQLIAVNGKSSGVLSGLINPAKIAVAGHSDGGDVMATVAANTCCRDGRVSAAIILSGAESPWALPGKYFAAPTPPMLFVQGTNDTIYNLPSASKLLYQSDTTGSRYYLDLFGANHFTPYEGSSPPEPLTARVTIDFLNRYLAGQQSATAAMRKDGQVSGVAALVSGGTPPP
jgi:dienelactone hydrolase